jgi:hypothetical protein
LGVVSARGRALFHHQPMRILFLFSLLFIGVESIAQIRVYPQNRPFFHEMVLNIEKGYVMPGTSNMWNDAIFTVRNNQIFRGFSTSPFDVLFTFRNGKLYKLDSMFSSDVLFTFKGGKIYKGDSELSLDQVFTVANGNIYLDRMTSFFDVLWQYDGNPTPAEVFAMLMALELI